MTIARQERTSWSKRARDYVKAVEADYVLSHGEEIVIVSLARAITREDALTLAMHGEPLAVANRFGELVNHPHVVELRQVGGLIAKLVGSLRLPEIVEAADGTRTAGRQAQKRTGSRGTYAPAGDATGDVMLRIVGHG
ncbi:hypothetical protein DFR67_103162 [Williamsia limnetica]|uniref:Uncharacterized protein n=1 Tax=Williamsia limnetica TaxID=882452 RepID=A0A318RNT8_WILLI|nr:hypothetical protein [Williamsia limnetica]PYE19251.1 hypothetical protein DFR67_103162 [Williamsia limnetica]